MPIDTVTFKKVTLPNSITNENVVQSHALDNQSPLTFYDFLKFSKEVITPHEYNVSYQNYLQKWYTLKNNTADVVTANIRDRYIELLKDISINYTSSEEKRFLSNIDYNNSNDVAIIIPFYSRKLIEICQFYIEKRDKLTFQVERNKIKGSNTSIKHAVFEEIVDYVFQNDEPTDYSISKTPLSAIASNLNIETEELFDFYNNYFDIDPNNTYSDYNVQTKERQDYFTSNINDIDIDLFTDFDAALRKSIFGNLVFLKEIGNNFSINYNFDTINLNCKPGDKLFEYITANKADNNRFLNLKKQLIEKYIGTDFYYLSTGTDITSPKYDKLFTAVNPSGNLLNRHFPSTATVPELSELESIRQFGLFFTPDKSGLLYFSYPDKKYIIDYAKLLPNKVYIFPDPTLYGNTTGLTRSTYEYPLIQIVDYTSSVNNASMYYAEGDIRINPYTQSFYSYFSVGQINNSVQTGISGLNVAFNNLYNKGIITDWKSDIYGNQFGVFKQKIRKNYTEIPSTAPKCIVIDGYQLYDNLEGYNFNYSLTGNYGTNTNRTGLTAQSPSLTATDYAYTLHFRELYPYEQCPAENVTCLFVDGGALTFKDGSLLPETYSTDSPSWPGNPTNTLYYYNTLYDAGTNFDVCNTSSTNYKLIDCDTFTGNSCKLVNDYDYTYKKSAYVDTIIDSSKTLFSSVTSNQDDMSLYDYVDLDGQAFVRNIGTSEVLHISAALTNIFTKYSSEIQTQLASTIKTLQVYNNFIFIETPSYLIIDKLVYKDLEFISPNTQNTVLNISVSAPCADPFIFENRNYCFVARLTSYNSNSNTVSYYPIIYKYNYTDTTLEKIYPVNTTSLATLTGIFASKLTSKIVRISKPKLTYNSRNDKFNLAFIGNDSNDLAYIYSITFNYKGNTVNIDETTVYNIASTATAITYNMYDLNTFTLLGLVSTTPLTSTPISIDQTAGTITIYG